MNNIKFTVCLSLCLAASASVASAASASVASAASASVASAASASGISATAAVSAAEESADMQRRRVSDKLELAIDLFDRGMYSRSQSMFAELSDKADDAYLENGVATLCAVMLKERGYPVMMEEYLSKYSYSGLIPQIRFRHALNLFDAGNYAGALSELELLKKRQLYKKQWTEFLFVKAYCNFSLGHYDNAVTGFKEVEAGAYSDYTAPAMYSLAYIYYQQRKFEEAEQWFVSASKDPRFSDISEFYILECRFMKKDYEYVAQNGPSKLSEVPQDRRESLSRIISESYLVLGDASRARYYFNNNAVSSSLQNREDFFYAGSVLYAAKDYQGAIDNFSLMTQRTDSIGQIANYNMGYCYIQTKNKVAAMGAFKDAASTGADPVIAEDAFFNYAKLAFDLNNDQSVFNDYLRKYSDKRKGDRIYCYIAMAALRNHDYAGAVAAYDNIDELDSDMKSNYMKAYYLRAEQLISQGSYRNAIPCLRASAYYSDRHDAFNQLTRFWLAESYYRDGQYDQAIYIFNDLYNISALYGMEESWLIPYNIAWCYFKKEDYAAADRWFTEYLSGNTVKYRKESLLRKGDGFFMRRRYNDAAEAYSKVLADYYDVNDIYPYYQTAMAYGLLGDDERKIAFLSRVKDASPSSDFFPEAMYELGRAYVGADKSSEAEKCFNSLVNDVRDSTYIAKGYMELGMLARNRSDSESALKYFKKVVKEFPMSGYLEDALLAIESVYRADSDPDSYLAYIESIGKASIKTEDEKQMMIFNAAEQLFLSENYPKAIVSLSNYLEKYPDGEKVSKAWYYMAECYKNTNQYERACDYYLKTMQNADGSVAEMAALNYANLSYQLERYDDAFSGYSSLYDIALIDNNRFTALIGMMRSSFEARNFAEAADYAGKVISDKRSSAQLKTEAMYIEAKSYLATSKRDEAFALLEVLSADPSSSQGAEAAYLIILDAYDKGEFETVENKVYAFADAASQQQYWLAKAFIVLGDSFAERGEYEQAEATFKSILSGYKPQGTDDIYDNVNFRLEKLGKTTETSTN